MAHREEEKASSWRSVAFRFAEMAHTTRVQVPSRASGAPTDGDSAPSRSDDEPIRVSLARRRTRRAPVRGACGSPAPGPCAHREPPWARGACSDACCARE
jgi:hypothetical protein